MRCCTVCLALVVAAVAALVHLAFSASQRVQEGRYEPPPSVDDLASGVGARLFRARPSDGGSLEYFEFGSTSANARVWVFVHGALSTGNVLRIFPLFEAEMEALDVRVVAPTMPGWGTSDPYLPLFEVSGTRWLQQWAQDSMALLDSLNITEFAVSGMSLGGFPATATATAAQKQGKLLALAPVIALTWNAADAGFDLAAHYSFGKRLGMALLHNQYLGSLAAECLRTMVLATDAAGFENTPMLPNDVNWDRGSWGADMQRSVRHSLAGQVQSNRLPTSTGGPFVDWSVFNASVPVYIFYGEQDDVVLPPVATYVGKKLPWAELVPFQGGHFNLDLFQVARTLFRE